MCYVILADRKQSLKRPHAFTSTNDDTGSPKKKRMKKSKQSLEKLIRIQNTEFHELRAKISGLISHHWQKLMLKEVLGALSISIQRNSCLLQ